MTRSPWSSMMLQNCPKPSGRSAGATPRGANSEMNRGTSNPNMPPLKGRRAPSQSRAENPGRLPYFGEALAGFRPEPEHMVVEVPSVCRGSSGGGSASLNASSWLPQ